MVALTDFRDAVAGLTLEEGDALSARDAALIRFGVAVSVTALDREAIERTMRAALSAGATAGQLQEILSLVSGLGVHSLMVASPLLLPNDMADATFDPHQQALWNRHVGDDPYWTAFERHFPGFLRAMLLLSGEQFAAFFNFCAVPWKHGLVRARLKELIALACDAAPTHRFLPGFRLHLSNAVALGAGRRAIDEALDIAASAPAHRGIA